MIHVLGSINIDYSCAMARLPAVGETVHADTLLLTPGGKGANQALAARRAGATVKMHGAIGKGETGSQALALLAAEQVDLDGVRRVTEPTGCAFISIDSNGENQIVVLAGANATVDSHAATSLPLQSGDVLLLQLEIPLNSVFEAARHAHTKGATVVASLAPYYEMPPEFFKFVDVLLLNQTEAQQLGEHLNLDSVTEAVFADKTRLIGKKFECSVIQTLGARGLVGWDQHTGHRFELVATKVTATDTVGAGDTFAGYLAAMLDGGNSLPDACKLASMAAAVACTRVGAQSAIPRISELN